MPIMRIKPTNNHDYDDIYIIKKKRNVGERANEKNKERNLNDGRFSFPFPFNAACHNFRENDKV